MVFLVILAIFGIAFLGTLTIGTIASIIANARNRRRENARSRSDETSQPVVDRKKDKQLEEDKKQTVDEKKDVVEEKTAKNVEENKNDTRDTEKVEAKSDEVEEEQVEKDDVHNVYLSLVKLPRDKGGDFYLCLKSGVIKSKEDLDKLGLDNSSSKEEILNKVKEVDPDARIIGGAILGKNESLNLGAVSNITKGKR